MDLERTRYAKRKKKKVNLILNISIAVVLLLIGVLVYQLFFQNDKEVAIDETEIEETNIDEEVEEEMDEQDTDEIIDEVVEEREEPLDRTPVEREEDNELTDTESEPAQEENVGQAGQWEPIGTVQQEPFVAVYEKDHVNWEEMTRALQVATGLGDDMIIWRLENGGDHQSAVGYVSTYENQNTPYEVRIEWVTNRGWKPVSVNQLSENRFIQNSNEQ